MWKSRAKNLYVLSQKVYKHAQHIATQMKKGKAGEYICTYIKWIYIQMYKTYYYFQKYIFFSSIYIDLL